MDSFKKGDTVVTKPGLWHNGTHLGDRLARVVDTSSYIFINVDEYDHNPVKCFRSEIYLLMEEDHKIEDGDFQIEIDWPNI